MARITRPGGGKPDEPWTMVLIPSAKRGGEAVAQTLAGSSGNCAVLVVPAIGNQEGLQAAAKLILGVASRKFILVYLGASSTTNSFTHSNTTEPPSLAE